jgi:AcrR family transcriptional regulator
VERQDEAVVGGDRRRRDLVEAAFRQIAERGFEGLRTREVAAAAGVNIATLHYYFPTKEALIRGVVERAMGRFRSTLEGPPGGQARLREHLRAVRRLLHEEPELGAVMAELALRSTRDAAIGEILRGTFAGWTRTMTGLLRNAVRDGEVRADLDVPAAAALAVSTLASMMLPPLAASEQGALALQELERWLGVDQSID